MNDIHYIVTTHSQLSKGYEKTIKFLTDKDNVKSITAYEDDEFPENLISYIDSCNENDYFVIFTDITCGSVTQKVLELYGNKNNFHIFSGINLPLVLEIIMQEEVPNVDSFETACETAKNEIVYFNGGKENTRK